MTTGDTFQNAARSRSALEELSAMIPGFQGYLKAEHRREADRLQRDFLARRIDEAREPVRAAAADWTDENRLSNLERATDTQDRLQRVASLVRNADAGYSGFFDTVQIDDAALETLYEIDKTMVSYVQELEGAAAALDPAGEDADCKKALRSIAKAAEDLEAAFAKRKDMIKGVS